MARDAERRRDEARDGRGTGTPGRTDHRAGWSALGLAALTACLGLASPARAAEPAAEPARLLADVHFVGSSTELDSEGRTRLAQDAAWLRDHPDVRLRIVGHTDPVGAVAANQALGAQRAEVVRRELVSLGVAASRLRTASAGAQDPRCMEASLFCETVWLPGSTQQVASETACPQAPGDCFAAERRATFWVVAP